MSVTPTRLLSKQSPLSDLTLDQLLLVHGQRPVIKSAPPKRTAGRPLTAEQLRGHQRPEGRMAYANPDNEPYLPTKAPRNILEIAEAQAEVLQMGKRQKKRQPTRSSVSGPISTQRTSSPPAPVMQAPSSGGISNPVAPAVNTHRPAPGVAHILVGESPDYDETEIDMTTPCGEVVELIFEVVGVGTLAYPQVCEVLGHHPNQPHMVRVYGRSQNPDEPEQDIFVGWDDVLQS